MFHLSISRLNKKVLKPRIPDAVLQGAENKSVPRVCFASTILGCFRALPIIVEDGMMFYVYTPEFPRRIKKIREHQLSDFGIYFPTKSEVFDIDRTGEIWFIRPVKIRLIGRIVLVGGVLLGEYITHQGEVKPEYDYIYEFIE